MLKPLVSFALGVTLIVALMHLGGYRRRPPPQPAEKLDTRGGGQTDPAASVGHPPRALSMDEAFRAERSHRDTYGFLLTLAGFSWLLVGAIWIGRRIPVPEDPSPADMKPPPGVQELTPARAAELLGVPLDAPRPVIEAALQTQLAARDLSQLSGLDLESRKYILQQCEELRKASHLLLSQEGFAFETDTPQG